MSSYNRITLLHRHVVEAPSKYVFELITHQNALFYYGHHHYLYGPVLCLIQPIRWLDAQQDSTQAKLVEYKSMPIQKIRGLSEQELIRQARETDTPLYCRKTVYVRVTALLPFEKDLYELYNHADQVMIIGKKYRTELYCHA